MNQNSQNYYQFLRPILFSKTSGYKIGGKQNSFENKVNEEKYRIG